MTSALYWEQVYGRHDPETVSWFESSPECSLAMIEDSRVRKDAAIIDLGGGSSRLAGELLVRGYSDITVADLSTSALDAARSRLGEDADRVNWVVADVRDHDFGREFDLWHDRALFHFMVDSADSESYLSTLNRSLGEGGHLIIATFGPDGPTECSGLPVRRYDVDELALALGAGYRPISSGVRVHRTPSGREQQFLWAHFQREKRS